MITKQEKNGNVFSLVSDKRQHQTLGDTTTYLPRRLTQHHEGSSFFPPENPTRALLRVF